jgi:hypothetical protein
VTGPNVLTGAQWSGAQYGPTSALADPTKPQQVSGTARTLTGSEWAEAQTKTADQVKSWRIPALPMPTIRADVTKEPVGSALTDTKGKQIEGPAGVLTRQLVDPVLEHPFQSAAILGAPFYLPGAAGVVAGGLIAGTAISDIARYGYQKYLEQDLSPEARAEFEKDPDRVSGEAAAAQAAMLGLGALIHVGSRATDFSGGMMEAGARAHPLSSAPGRNSVPRRDSGRTRCRGNIALRGTAREWRTERAPGRRQAGEGARADCGRGESRSREAGRRADGPGRREAGTGQADRDRTGERGTASRSGHQPVTPRLRSAARRAGSSRHRRCSPSRRGTSARSARARAAGHDAAPSSWWTESRAVLRDAHRCRNARRNGCAPRTARRREPVPSEFTARARVGSRPPERDAILSGLPGRLLDGRGADRQPDSGGKRSSRDRARLVARRRVADERTAGRGDARKRADRRGTQAEPVPRAFDRRIGADRTLRTRDDRQGERGTGADAAVRENGHARE